jgi:hypothetical protein
VFLGALNLTKEAYEKAKTLKMKETVQDTLLGDVERQCKRTETFFGRNVNSFNQGIKDNENTLIRLNEEMNNLNQEIPKLNQQVRLNKINRAL